MATAPCPICKKPAEADRARNRAWPFCSSRCKTVDLGRWLGEDYRIASVEHAQPDANESSVPPRGEK